MRFSVAISRWLQLNTIRLKGSKIIKFALLLAILPAACFSKAPETFLAH